MFLDANSPSEKNSLPKSKSVYYDCLCTVETVTVRVEFWTKMNPSSEMWA